MNNEIYIRFEEGMPKGTAQEKGECIKYRIQNGKRVPYIHHYKKDKVASMRRLFELSLMKYRPKQPSEKPIKLEVYFFFDVTNRKLWGKYKTKRPDCDNYIKELKDAMTSVGFWKDDAQVCELKIVKRYSEKATIVIRVEELKDG